MDIEMQHGHEHAAWIRACSVDSKDTDIEIDMDIGIDMDKDIYTDMDMDVDYY
jgi:hypothetical protein